MPLHFSTLTASLQTRIIVVEMRCFRRLLRISYKNHITNEEVRNRISEHIGQHEDLLTTIKKRIMKWYGHITKSDGLAKTVLQGTVHREKEERKTEEEMGRQPQRMDREKICLKPSAVT